MRLRWADKGPSTFAEALGCHSPSKWELRSRTASRACNVSYPHEDRQKA